jgi:hypothetical protein
MAQIYCYNTARAKAAKLETREIKQKAEVREEGGDT